MNQSYKNASATSTRILQFDTGAVIGEGAPIEGLGSLGEAQGIARAVSPVVSLDGGLAGTLDGVASLEPAVSPEMRRAAMYLFESERDRRKALWKAVLAYGKGSPEWSRTLTAPEADRWRERIEVYGDRVNRLGKAPFIDGTVAELAANLARGCARFSHLPSQQRMRAYKRAARVRSVNAERNESILQDRAAGLSQRRLAARYGVSRGCVEKVIVSAKKPPETAPAITAKKPPRAAPISTAKKPPDRLLCRPSDPEQVSTTNNEVGTGPPLKVAGGPVLVVTEREGAAPTDKAGGCGRGQPSHGAPAPAGATSHPLVTLPTETEPASGSATDGGPEPKGPKVGERVAVVDVLRAVAAAKAGTRLPSERCPLLPDPDVVARDDVRRELFRRQAASRGVVIPEVGNDG